MCLLSKWKREAWITAHLFTAWLTESFKPTVETHCSEEKIPFKMVLTNNAPGKPRVLIEMCSWMYVVFMPANIKSIWQLTDQGVILTQVLLKKYIS